MTVEQDKTQERPIKRILLAYNDTDQSERAFVKSLHLAKDNDATLLGVMWLLPNTVNSLIPFARWINMFRTVDEGDKILSLAHLEEVTKKLGIKASFNVDAVYRKDMKELGMAIVSLAQKQGIDVIVIGDGKPLDEKEKDYVNVADIVEQNASCKVIRIK